MWKPRPGSERADRGRRAGLAPDTLCQHSQRAGHFIQAFSKWRGQVLAPILGVGCGGKGGSDDECLKSPTTQQALRSICAPLLSTYCVLGTSWSPLWPMRQTGSHQETRVKKRLEGLPWWSSSHDSAFRAGGPRSTAGQGIKVPHVVWSGQKKERERETRKLLKPAHAVGIGVPGLSHRTLVITLSGRLLTIPVTQSRTRGPRLPTRISTALTSPTLRENEPLQSTFQWVSSLQWVIIYSLNKCSVRLTICQATGAQQ